MEITTSVNPCRVVLKAPYFSAVSSKMKDLMSIGHRYLLSHSDLWSAEDTVPVGLVSAVELHQLSPLVSENVLIVGLILLLREDSELALTRSKVLASLLECLCLSTLELIRLLRSAPL